MSNESHCDVKPTCVIQGCRIIQHCACHFGYSTHHPGAVETQISALHNPYLALENHFKNHWHGSKLISSCTYEVLTFVVLENDSNPESKLTVSLVDYASATETNCVFTPGL